MKDGGMLRVGLRVLRVGLRVLRVGLFELAR
jgi:hypothetical protein